MFGKSVVVLWGIVFSLALFLSCSGGGGGGSGATITEVKKEDGKVEVVLPEAPITIQLEVVPASKTMRPGESFTFSAKGGEGPFTFSAKFGAIDKSGLYTFSEGLKEGDVVQVTDNKGKVASSIIFGDFSNMWTWVSGSNSSNRYGNYGEKGVASDTSVPGARGSAVTWADASGNLWLFGGSGNSSSSGGGILNDLWKFNIAINQWTWVSGDNAGGGIYGMKGVPSSSNLPGVRFGSVSWTDASGNLWLFGGHGELPSTGLGPLNHLWKYNIATNQWTWVSGSLTDFAVGVYGTKGVPSSTNVPGARKLSVSWTDASGNLWLFGGSGYSGSGGGGLSDGGALNDLWKYNIAINQWTWVSGSSTRFAEGIYGTKGEGAPTNVPGARDSAVGWTDTNGNLWLFGGFSYSSSVGFLNDLWKFDTKKNLWTWVGGSRSANQAGINGTKGIPSSGNVPGGRSGSVSWTDPNGYLWLFGGLSYSSSAGFLNELWKFDTKKNLWTWVGGSASVDQAGSYGKKGIPSSGNVPRGRSGSVSWRDASGNLWLFGGLCVPSYGVEPLNDLWKFTPPRD